MGNITRVSPNLFKGLNLTSPDGSMVIKQGNSNLYTKNLSGYTYTGELTTSDTGALQVPQGTSAQRPVGANGKIRFNNTSNAYEGFNENSGTWGPIGVTGVGTGYLEHNNVVYDDSSIAPGKNAISAGPVTIAPGAAITVPTGSVWTVV